MNNWKEIYQSKVTTAEEAVTHIQDGDLVVIGHLVGAPLEVIDAMVKNYKNYKNVTTTSMLTSDDQPYAKPEYQGHFHPCPMFLGKETRKAMAAGYADYIPTHFSDVPYLLENINKPDVALIVTSPPDEDGYVSLGLTADYTLAAAKLARTVIAEVNPNCPYMYGDTKIPVSRIECIVETNREIPAAPKTKVGDIERAIGKNVSELIKDGDCLQIGLGAIPDAILEFLTDKKDLGIQSEIIGDGVKTLYDAGAITGAKKEIHTGKIIATALYGSPSLNEWANKNPMFEIYPIDYTNDVRVISQISNLVSINSCLAVDFTGQVCAEQIGDMLYSGVGGLNDFVRGARMSKGGRSIIACPSTAKGGTISKIVPKFAEGMAVSVTRTDVDYIVTEYGVAALRGRSFRDRAKALIAIAHPKFREELNAEYKKIFG